MYSTNEKKRARNGADVLTITQKGKKTLPQFAASERTETNPEAERTIFAIFFLIASSVFLQR